jgi:Zn-dependent protease with chaperone function
MKRALLTIAAVALILSDCAHGRKIEHYGNHTQQAYVEAALSRCLAGSGIGPSDVRYCIWLKPEVTNAFMTEEAVLIITTGLLDRVQKEGNRDILPSVIAHEVAHYKLNHIRKQQVLSTALNAGFTVLGFVIPGAGYGNYLVHPLATKAYSRSQELDADKEAVDILRKGGWRDPVKMYVDTMKFFEKSAQGPGFTLWASHPTFQDRIEYVSGRQRDS